MNKIPELLPRADVVNYLAGIIRGLNYKVTLVDLQAEQTVPPTDKPKPKTGLPATPIGITESVKIILGGN